MGETLGRWRIRTVWLAERQVWGVLADRSQCLGQDVARQRCQEIRKSHEGDTSNEEN